MHASCAEAQKAVQTVVVTAMRRRVKRLCGQRRRLGIQWEGGKPRLDETNALDNITSLADKTMS
jgi:hypothetical protein